MPRERTLLLRRTFNSSAGTEACYKNRKEANHDKATRMGDFSRILYWIFNAQCSVLDAER